MYEDYYAYVKRVFKILAPFYDYIDLFVSRLREKVVDFTSPASGSKILDVATGTGRQAFAFARRGYTVFGIDISEDMLRVANRNNRYKNVKFQIADAAHMPFENNSFDVSCVSFALHDMPSEIREKVLKEMARVTRPQGTIVIVDYGLPKNRIGKYLTYLFVKSYESKYYPEFMKSGPEALLKKAGIEIVGESYAFGGTARILKAKKPGNN